MKTKNDLQPAAGGPSHGDPRSPTDRRTVYYLKIHILNISPMICRRFIIDGNTHIAELHHLIQMIMGWKNQHLHVFHYWQHEVRVERVEKAKLGYRHTICAAGRRAFPPEGVCIVHRIKIGRLVYQ